MSFTNISLSEKLLSELIARGVHEFVVCPGGRNSPLVKVIGHNPNLKIHYYYEERSAGFFALGLAKKSSKPTAVVTTSGTAVAELFPAMIEAKYSGVPLVALTADRPEAYRHVGAPQSMNQIRFFADYAKAFSNWSQSNQMPIEVFSDQPVHINIEFDEPLVDAELADAVPVALKTLKIPKAITVSDFDSFSEKDFSTFKSPLFLLSGLNQKESAELKTIFSKHNTLYFAEATSGLLSEANNLRHLPENILEAFDCVIRVGSVPTHRVWRDLEQKLIEMPVFSFSNLPFSGLSRKSKVFSVQDINKLPWAAFSASSLSSNNWEKLNQTKEADLQSQLSMYPLSEYGFVNQLANGIQPGSQIYLGNSLSIRQWDLVGVDKDFRFFSNRGMNGIDGLIASFIGASVNETASKMESWLLLGDLSALYDLSSLHLAKEVNEHRLRIVVMNNKGGRIFTPMFKDVRFENAHELDFSMAAKMFGWSYRHVKNIDSNFKEIFTSTEKHLIVEIEPSAVQSDNFWKAK